ncbi:hypothetical protein HYU50_02135 [Candidatus Woesearchaeota archaeon]|nr:hypothetical protein [Candidatus Woesearchaeota archaeon]
MKRLLIFMFLVLLLVPIANAKSGHMKLLAVSDRENGQVGGIADLYLEINPGSGRVFLETFPLTKVDTQISTRLAKEIACDYADADCSKYDFFYTITADSPIIAGPSAGAAITALTFSLIRDVPLDKNTAITGTINSGGLIGPVGGLKAKIEAASKDGIKKVLIPLGEAIDREDNTTADNETAPENETFDLEELREKYGIKIIEVSTIDEALFEFTGKRFREKKSNLTISQNYKDTMKLLAIQLCSRSTRLRDETANFAVDNRTRQVMENAVNLSIKGRDSFKQDMFYSSASYCFGSNVEFNYLSLLHQNPTEKEIIKKSQDLKDESKQFNDEIENEELKTITDLESYMVVKERLKEADDFLGLVLETIENKNSSLHNLAYAEERLNSAKSWSQFLKNTGKEFNLNQDVIKNACRTKLAEVEERLQYVQLYLPQSLESTRKELDYAYKDLEEGNYELCLFMASKAKANVDTVLSVFGVATDNVKTVVENKLEIAERNLVEETEKGVFPILGYSYFEYANSLKDSDIFSALLYSGYALELSSLDIYFKSKNITPQAAEFSWSIDKNLAVGLIAGLIFGIAITRAYYFGKNPKKKAKRKR